MANKLCQHRLLDYASLSHWTEIPSLSIIKFFHRLGANSGLSVLLPLTIVYSNTKSILFLLQLLYITYLRKQTPTSPFLFFLDFLGIYSSIWILRSFHPTKNITEIIKLQQISKLIFEELKILHYYSFSFIFCLSWFCFVFSVSVCLSFLQLYPIFAMLHCLPHFNWITKIDEAQEISTRGPNFLFYWNFDGPRTYFI